MRCLFDGKNTIEDLVEETGLSDSTVRGYVKALREQKLVRIVDLLEAANGSRCKHVYQWDPDKPDFKVRKRTQAERAAKYRARKARKLTDAGLHFAIPVETAVELMKEVHHANQ
jgi:DeoR/GlpR family transcriptional regulator of sugar metabolism